MARLDLKLQELRQMMHELVGKAKQISALREIVWKLELSLRPSAEPFSNRTGLRKAQRRQGGDPYELFHSRLEREGDALTARAVQR